MGKTVGKRITYDGIGLHTGQRIRMALCAANAGSGIVLVRTDQDGAHIPARATHVVATALSTTLGKNGATIQTTEHILAAAYGLGIGNLRIELDGPEVPIADGSALPFVHLLQEAGIVDATAGHSPAQMEVAIRPPPIRRVEGEASIAIEPASSLEIAYTIHFDHPKIGTQQFVYHHSPARFIEQIAPARTFCLLKDVERMRAAGLARGGSLDNAVVLDETGILNAGGLRFPDECARHKVLDLLGDLALLGHPLHGRIEAVRAGHRLHVALVRAIPSSP